MANIAELQAELAIARAELAEAEAAEAAVAAPAPRRKIKFVVKPKPVEAPKQNLVWINGSNGGYRCLTCGDYVSDDLTCGRCSCSPPEPVYVPTVEEVAAKQKKKALQLLRRRHDQCKGRISAAHEAGKPTAALVAERIQIERELAAFPK